MTVMNELKEQIETRLEKIKNHSGSIALFGAGARGKLAQKQLASWGIQAECFCDNNTALQGQKVNGLYVAGIDEVCNTDKNYMILITTLPKNALAIQRQLEEKNTNIPIYHFTPSFKVDDELYPLSDFTHNQELFQQFHHHLADEISQKIFLDALFFRCAGDGLSVASHAKGDTFFDDSILPAHENHTYVDLGAYTGDTLMRFYSFCRGQYKKIIAVEASENNFSRLKSFVESACIKDVELHQIGIWSNSKEEKLSLQILENNSTGSSGFIWGNASFFPQKGNAVEAENQQLLNKGEISIKYKKVPIMTIDELIKDTPISLLKINILAADYYGLQGATKTISNHKPAIILEFGTKIDHFADTIAFFMQYKDIYNFYLREKFIFDDIKTVLYATKK